MPLSREKEQMSKNPLPLNPGHAAGRPQGAARRCLRSHGALILSLLAVCLTAPVLTAGAQTQRRAGTIRHSVVSPWDVEAREYLGTPASEAAVNKGLAFLATHQEADGHWSSAQYSSDVGITGLCLLSFLAAGHQPGRGRYGLVMSEAVDFLANSIRMDGQYAAPGLVRSTSGGPPMYGHGFATLALSEVYGMDPKRRDLKPKVQAAIKLIEDTQTLDGQPSRDGGWRYQPVQGEADLSVTVVQVLAMRAARNAGLKVAQSTIDRAVAYMKRCAGNPDGGFNYQVGQRASGPARTGAGCLSLMMAGMRDSAECQGGLKYLQAHPLDPKNDWPYREHYFYAIYYVTQALYQAGGDYWKQWYPTIRDRLVSGQEGDGCWSRANNYSEAGVNYATAMSVLVLQVPAGLLPIYQK